MILKVGRLTAPKNWIWNYISDIGSIIVHSNEQPTPNFPDKCEVTDITYFSNNTTIKECQSVSLSGLDCCYLMNDEGKTVERIR